jgi:hypothetical protein
MEHVGKTAPISTVEEMTAWLASDLQVPVEKVHAWTIIIAVDMEEHNGTGLVVRVSDPQPNPYLILGEIEALSKALTGSEDPEVWGE